MRNGERLDAELQIVKFDREEHKITKSPNVICRETVELCRRAEAMGASWITIHGRTPQQRTEPVNTEAIRLIADSLSLPVVANGDVTTLNDALSLVDTCHVKGRCPVCVFCYLNTLCLAL